MRIQNTFDVIVIGSGSAGFSAAETAASAGASVCLIESDTWGGECPNFACVPTKAMLKSARVYFEAKKHLSEYGVHASSVTFHFREMMQRKDAVVHLITGHGTRIPRTAKQLGITTIRGTARFVDPHTIAVGNRNIRGKKMILATGAVDVIPPIEGLKESGYLMYRDLTEKKRPPRSLAIIGGGPVGCEFATFFAMLGIPVSLFQISPVLLQREDEEISLLVEKNLSELGVRVFTSTRVTSVQKSGFEKRITFQKKTAKRSEQMLAHDVLVASGRRPNIDHLQLDKARVKVDKKGALVLSSTLQTSQPHIFAAGDVSNGPMFTHTAHEDGLLAGMNAVARSARAMKKRDSRTVPRVTFVYPEVASVGMTAREAVASGMNPLIGRFPVGALGRAVTDGQRNGLVKIIADPKTRRVLGGHILCDRAGEMIHELTLAMSTDRTVDEIAETTHAFPTYSEAIQAAAASI